MTTDWDGTGDGIFDYNIADGINYIDSPEPASIMMSYSNPTDNKNHVYRNEVNIGPGGDNPNITKNTRIFGGIDVSNQIYTNRGFGYVTFGRVLQDGEMENYQKCINRFQDSMSRSTY
jgi:hypothetical protein